MIYERLDSHEERATLRRVCQKFNLDLKNLYERTICITPFPPSVEAFGALAADSVQMPMLKHIVFADMEIWGGEELPNEMFLRLNEEQAMLYEEEWRREWHDYRQAPAAFYYLCDTAARFTNLRTISFHLGYLEAQTRAAGEERPNTLLSQWELFVVPNEPDMFEKYEAKHWQHRGSGLVFKAPNWDNLEWRAHSRALFWEMVHSIRSVRGRTMPLRVDGLYYTPLRVARGRAHTI
jgi:hypothetical protein